MSFFFRPEGNQALSQRISLRHSFQRQALTYRCTKSETSEQAKEVINQKKYHISPSNPMHQLPAQGGLLWPHGQSYWP
ncbi:unnamed protein product [Protopolystoma xenopodis]|uniref:Uncharacterized protein n=1 Tax=Protopolystoma xenopodis TaxID=117903 RepID=A0A3S4ZSX0_9PLAT|nr:unnamed protein product [Protopolystoma xenopodis]